MPQRLRYNLVDVFTDRPLCGNPLAVFTSAVGLSDERMQAIAREMNLSETVFLLPAQGDGHARLRIFTPKKELPFAGHPVLGSAWVLGGPMEFSTLRLETGVGIVEVALERAGDRLHLAWMTQPTPSFERDDDLAAAVHAALGLSPDFAPDVPTVVAHNGPSHVLVRVPDVSAVTLDVSSLARATEAGVLVHSTDDSPLGGEQETRVRARYFAPSAGILEDPATGSAAGPLGAHLHQVGHLATGQTLTVRQGLEMGRDSLLLVRFKQVDTALRVEVGGAAVVVGRGELSL